MHTIPRLLAQDVSHTSLLVSYAMLTIYPTDWNKPYRFFNNDYKVKDESGTFQKDVIGTLGTFLGMW